MYVAQIDFRAILVIFLSSAQNYQKILSLVMYLSLSVKWFSLFISVSLATRCEDIGYKGQYFMDPGHIHDDTRNAGQRAPVYPNPFDQGMGWNVVEAKDCWVRFQTAPKDTPESLRTAKVDTLLWDATEDQVTTTMENYNWSPGNIMLWHKLNVFALRNANIIAKTDVPYDAQPRLNLREMVVSISKYLHDLSTWK